jgi:hypothetical protein
MRIMDLAAQVLFRLIFGFFALLGVPPGTLAVKE